MKEKSYVINLHLSPELAVRLDEVQTRMMASSKSEVMRRLILEAWEKYREASE